MTDILELADELIAWARASGADTTSRISRGAPSARSVESVRALHPQLAELYVGSNGVSVVWEQADKFGVFSIPTAMRLVRLATESRGMRADWTDDEVSAAVRRADWPPLLPLFRSLVDFHDEGNGDSVCVSSLDGKCYFLAHDWMDWISDDLPLFQVAESVEDFYRGWATVRFAPPKDHWWMNTLADGRFAGFTQEYFCGRSATC